MQEDSFLDLIRGRRSVRRFRSDYVEESKMETILEAARWAPSNHNRQAWKFIVIRNRPLIERMCDVAESRIRQQNQARQPLTDDQAADLLHNATLFGEAPIVILALHRKPNAISQTYLQGVSGAEAISGELISSAMAVQNLLLAAHCIGLGACVMTAPLVAADEIKALVGIGTAYQLTALIALGYPAEAPTSPRRKPIERIADFIKEDV